MVLLTEPELCFYWVTISKLCHAKGGELVSVSALQRGILVTFLFYFFIASDNISTSKVNKNYSHKRMVNNDDDKPREITEWSSQDIKVVK